MKRLLVYSSLFALHFSLITAQSYTISTFAGISTTGFSGDGGLATVAELDFPQNVAISATTGNIYIADAYNERIRMVNTNGMITTIAGNGTSAYSGDGGAATAAEFIGPYGVEADNSGNVYIADWLNNRIRKVNTSGIISTIAGSGTGGYSGDGGPATAAKLMQPSGLFADRSGNLYFTDDNNNGVRMVNTGGIISTIAGNGYDAGLSMGGYSGDGGSATAAELSWPSEVTQDDTGNIYIADEYNNRIRKVDTNGIISTVAGNGTRGYFGDGGQATSAELNWPSGIAFDNSGNMFIGDYKNNRIRIVNPSGIISTIAGIGIAGYSGDGGPADSAELNGPIGIQVDASGNVYFADLDGNHIRKLTLIKPTGISNLEPYKGQLTIFPNPGKGIFTLIMQSYESGIKNIEVYNVLGENVFTKTLPSSKGDNYSVDLKNQPNGIYLYRLLTLTGELVEEGKLIIQK